MNRYGFDLFKISQYHAIDAKRALSRMLIATNGVDQMVTVLLQHQSTNILPAGCR